MRRRDLLALVAGAASLRPLVAGAQKAMPVVGYLGPGTLDATLSIGQKPRNRRQP
jgi:hypothetical protein